MIILRIDHLGMRVKAPFAPQVGAPYKFRQLGLAAFGFEAAPDVGGTWYWNCYPGARCDVESLDYSYSFSAALLDAWTWSERFAT